MRVTLLHNKSAGSENHAAEELEASVRRAGHDVVETVSSRESLLASINARRPDLVAIAGGDGTVSRTACALASCGVPLAIIPLGTANNTAFALGVRGSVDVLVQTWSAGRLVPFDLGTVTVGDMHAPFSEAVGWGVFPSVMANTARLSSPDEVEHTLKRDRRVFQSVIEVSEARSYAIVVDGVSVTGQFLLVEIVNIPWIGPRLGVSPDSDASDGLLEVVVAGEADRPALLELIETGELPSGSRLRTLRGRHVTVQTADTAFHRDGSLIESVSGSAEFAVRVMPAAVSYLVEPGRE